MVNGVNWGAVVLAAGKGTRLNCRDLPKVMLPLGGRPIVSYIVSTLNELGFGPSDICLVIGYQKEKVKDYFRDKVSYAVQEIQEGTAQAAYVGLKALPADITQVMVLGGDDSAFYSAETLSTFIAFHQNNRAVLSLLTSIRDQPAGLGRVIRDGQGNFVGVKEKEELTKEEETIKEISTGTYCLQRSWFENNFSQIVPINGLNEYGLPAAIKLAQSQGEKVVAQALAKPEEWWGINTKEELVIAQKRKE